MQFWLIRTQISGAPVSRSDKRKGEPTSPTSFGCKEHRDTEAVWGYVGERFPCRGKINVMMSEGQ